MKVTSRVEKGNITAMGHQLPIEVYAKAPDKRLSIMHFPNSDSITAFDGTTGWLSNNGHFHMMSASDNAAERIDADLHFAADVKSLFKKFTVAPGEKIDGHDTYLVIGRNEGGRLCASISISNPAFCFASCVTKIPLSASIPRNSITPITATRAA